MREYPSIWPIPWYIWCNLLPPPTQMETDTCENITFSQLRLRAVKIPLTLRQTGSIVVFSTLLNGFISWFYVFLGRILDQLIEPAQIRLPLENPDRAQVHSVSCGRAHTVIHTSEAGLYQSVGGCTLWYILVRLVCTIGWEGARSDTHCRQRW